jgi:hypothetical protein
MVGGALSNFTVTHAVAEVPELSITWPQMDWLAASVLTTVDGEQLAIGRLPGVHVNVTVTSVLFQPWLLGPGVAVAEIEGGVTETGGSSVTVAEADFVVSAWLVAVTVTDCWIAIAAGAVYRPLAPIVPTPAGLAVHVTDWLVLFATVAVKLCVPLAYSVAVPGTTLTDTGGSSVIVAEADLVESAWLVAVTVTVCCVVIVAGAVYTPLALIVPTPSGLIVHVTAWFVLFATVAVKLCVPFEYRVAAPGVTLTDTGGSSVTVADADFAASAWLVAVTVTVCCDVIVVGAV